MGSSAAGGPLSSGLQGSPITQRYPVQQAYSERGTLEPGAGTEGGGPDDVDGDGDGVRMRSGHTGFRTGPGARIPRASHDDPGFGSDSGGRKPRRRWADGKASQGGGPGPAAINTGHTVRMKRAEAWGKFLAYEGSCQVCMMEATKNTKEAFVFLESGCQSLRKGLGIEGLLLPPVMSSHVAGSIDMGQAIDLGNEIVWDDQDVNADRRLGAGAFLNHMSLLRVRVAKLTLPGRGFWSKLTCKKATGAASLTVHLRAPSAQSYYAPGTLPFRLGPTGLALPGSPVWEMQPDEQATGEVVLEVSDGVHVLARGLIPSKRVWQIGMEHAAMAAEEGWDEGAPPSGLDPGAQEEGGICNWFAGEEESPLRPGTTGLWVNVFGEAQTRFGQVLLSIERLQREMPDRGSPVPGGERDAGTSARQGALKVSSCQAYDHLLLAALKTQACDERRLEVSGEWAWLLRAFAGHYGVRSNYALMSHLRWVLKPGVASVSRHCFDLISAELRPLLEQEAMRSLTGQEATLLGRIKRDVEELLKLAFENYYLLSSSARKGILEGATHPPSGEFPPEALVAAVRLYESMRDVFAPSDNEWLADRFRVAAKSRWARLAAACDDGLYDQQAPLSQHLTGKGRAGGSPAGKAQAHYARMTNLANAIMQDLDYDQRLQDIPRLLPTSLNLPGLMAEEFCSHYVAQLTGVLDGCPPNQPTPASIDLLVGVAGLQRYLEDRGLALPRGHPGCIDAVKLFGHHVHSWITNSQEMLCATCRNLEATTELSATGMAATQPACPLGSSEEGGVAPIVHEMLHHVVNEMHRYERVIMHWPVFGPYMEAALCSVLRAVIAAVSRQCGMTCRPPGTAGGGDPAGSKGSPYKRRGGGSSGGGGQQSSPGGYGGGEGMQTYRTRPASSLPQWTWQSGGPDSPRRGGGSSVPGLRPILLMVREAVLLNSLKRLMVAVPNYETQLTKWAGSGSMGGSGAAAAASGGSIDDDVAAYVGAQFAQVVKELRVHYATAVSSSAERMSSSLGGTPATDLPTILAAASSKAATTSSALQQSSLVERLAEPLFGVLDECSANLRDSLDGRVYVAMVRGLWDFVGRDLFDYVEALQDGAGQRGAWRARQNASTMLGLINRFFQATLQAHLEHTLQERDLAVPKHIDAIQQLLAVSTTALNNSYTPF